MTCLSSEFVVMDKEENKVYTSNSIIDCMFRACGWDVVDATPYADYCLDTEAWD